MKRLILAATLLPCFAQGKPLDTTLSGWRGALSDDPRLAVPVMAVVKPGAKGYAVVQVGNVEAFEKLSGFKVRTPAEFDWHAKINGAKPTLSGNLQAIAKTLRVDLVVLSQPGTAWQLATANATTEVAAPKTAPRLAADWSAWFNSALGYDGVVIATEADYVLIRRTSADFDRSPFGLIVGNSATAVTLTADKRQGVGMIRQIENDGTFAVFRLQMGDRAGIPSGTKILLQ